MRNYQQTPDNIALIASDDGKRMTYGELFDKAMSVKQMLEDIGVKPHDYVGITLPRGIDQWCQFSVCYCRRCLCTDWYSAT